MTQVHHDSTESEQLATGCSCVSVAQWNRVGTLFLFPTLSVDPVLRGKYCKAVRQSAHPVTFCVFFSSFL